LGIVTAAPTQAAELFEDPILNVMPPAGAADPRVTVPTTFVAALPFTVAGLTFKDVRLGGLTTSTADWLFAATEA
jgi:hypothetical protein